MLLDVGGIMERIILPNQLDRDFYLSLNTLSEDFLGYVYPNTHDKPDKLIQLLKIQQNILTWQT